MRFFLSAAVGSLAALAIAAPAAHHVLHEKRSHIPDGWEKSVPAEKGFVLPVRIGLKQSNMDIAHDRLMEISDPSSPSYGKHMSTDEIVDFFAPSDDTVQKVKEWLSSSGINNVKSSYGKGWLEFKATVADIEDLLKTKYHRYEHESGKPHIACEEYSVPAHIQEHIDIITPTMHFDVPIRHSEDPKFKRSLLDRAMAKRALEADVFGGPKIGGGLSGGPKIGKVLSGNKGNAAAATDCGNYITSGCLRTLYQMPKTNIGLNLSSFGIVEYAPETFTQADLNKFESNISETNYDLTTNTGGEPVGTGPKVEGIDGGYLVPNPDYTVEAEPNLDLQYAIDLTYPQTVTLYQVGDNGTNSAAISFNNFLDGIDGSYCTYMGGDDPYYDETFPDPGGYQGKQQCGVWSPTKVISVSYSYNEHDLSPAYEIRQCNEYMKLGMSGVSVFYSSGDYGVAGNRNQCINADGTYNSGTSGRFNPSFPGTCPYITSVGATEIPVGSTATKPEVACETVIYSGGGFSNVFAQPSYQKSALATYYKNHKPTYPASRWNSTQVSRGFPDVSANGANYIVYLDGTAYLLYGTSASSPVFASIITLINNVRAKAGKASLGFLNPFFYSHPGMFHDIKSGNNPGCGTNGFAAVPGWDPLTGLGTPNYNKMLAKLS